MSAWVVTMGAGATMGSCIRRLPFHPKEQLGPQSITWASEMAKHNSGVNSLWTVAQRLATPETWGLIKKIGIMIEPYTCAAALVQECLNLIDEIAAATDVEALFMHQQVPKLMDAPP